MNPLSIALLLLLQLAANPKVSAPPYPPLAFRGGTVVAVGDAPEVFLEELASTEAFLGTVTGTTASSVVPGCVALSPGHATSLPSRSTQRRTTAEPLCADGRTTRL